MKNPIYLLFSLLMATSCGDSDTKEKTEPKVDTVVVEETAEPKLNSSEIYYKSFINDLSSPEKVAAHIQFPLHDECAYTLTLGADQTTFSSDFFIANYEEIFTEEVIEALKNYELLTEGRFAIDDSGNETAFYVTLSFKEPIEGMDEMDEWAVIFTFSRVGDTFMITCIQGAG